jgi:hypothetical protein
MRKPLYLALVTVSLAFQMTAADVNEYEFEDMMLEGSTFQESDIVEQKPLKRIPLVVKTHDLEDKPSVIDKVEASIDSNTSGQSSVSFDNRSYKGMLVCEAECPIDPDEFRNTWVQIDEFTGVALIDAIRKVLPMNWSVRVDNVNPKRLMEKYAFTSNNTREKTLNYIAKASDLSFKFFHENYNNEGIHSPILLVYTGDQGL